MRVGNTHRETSSNRRFHRAHISPAPHTPDAPKELSEKRIGVVREYLHQYESVPDGLRGIGALERRKEGSSREAYHCALSDRVASVSAGDTIEI